MKVRIYYNGHENLYYPQYRWCFMWWYFTKFDRQNLYNDRESFRDLASIELFLKNLRERKN